MTTYERNLAIYYAYRILNLTGTEVGNEFNLSPNTIRNYCSRIGMKENEEIVEKLGFIFYHNHHLSYTNSCGEIAYLVYLKDKNIYKVGYTKQFSIRKKQLEKKYESEIVPIAFYHFQTQGQALHMESHMRDFFKEQENSIFIRNDRFKDIDLSEEVLNCFISKSREI